MSRDTAWELAGLEQELAAVRKQVEEADHAAAERRRGMQSRAVAAKGMDDVMPLRDRISVLEQKVARLRTRRF